MATLNIKIRLVNGESFPISVPADATAAQLKAAIEAAKGEGFAASLQKLVCAGKVLGDDAGLAAAGIKDDGFVVCRVTKAKVGRPEALRSRANSCRARR